MVRPADIPIAKTPPGGWHGEMPPLVYAGCDEPLVAGAPDLRGTWRVVAVEPDIEAVRSHVERIEQVGDRLCVTSEPIIHDMVVDGTAEHGVHDVDPHGNPIAVAASYEDGVHVLRPVGLPGVEVTRRLDGDQLVWVYGPLFTARLERIAEPS